MKNFLNGSAVGMTFISSYQPSPTLAHYDQVEFYGNGVFDKIYGTNNPLDKSLIDSWSAPSWKPTWKLDTYLLAEFDGSASGGNVPNISDPIKRWVIYRLDMDTQDLKRVGETDVDVETYVDYTNSKGRRSQYWIIAANDTEMSSPLKTDVVVTDYYGWHLIDIERRISYAFNLNQTGGNVSQNENVTEYNTNQKYNVYSRGASNFIEGSVQALVAEDCLEFGQSLEFLESIREFIVSGRPAIVKDDKGRVFKAFVSGYQETPVVNNIEGDYKYISFNFKECGEV